MKKGLFSFISFIFLSSSLLIGCSSKTEESTLRFAQSEYTIQSGESVQVENHSDKVTYSFVTAVPSNISLDASSGKITFTDIPHYTQVLYKATDGKSVTDPVVINLVTQIETPTLSFIETTDYICNKNYIYATSSTNTSIKYSLKEAKKGISIDPSSGLVSYNNAVEEGTKFTVVISSNGVSEEKEFTVALSNLSKVVNPVQATEKDNLTPVSFVLDYSDVDASFGKGVVKLISNHHILGEETYEYDPSENKLVVKQAAYADFNTGENTLTVVTPRNMVDVTIIIVTKIIRTPEELAAINGDLDALSGYFILGNDIDLSAYTSKGGDGYHGGKGWDPIGIYNDVTDGTAFKYTFKGTFDGNGYKVTGLNINRKDALGFNAGLFGYVYNSAVIKNLGVESSNSKNMVASFSGGFAGVNEGRITNCWSNVNISNNYSANAYRIVGGFVGRNAGTITNCYSIGKVDGEANIGAFVGSNEGIIEYCYATKEGYENFCTGIDPVNSFLYDTIDEFKNDSDNLPFDEQYWDVTAGELPALKHSLVFLFPYFLTIKNQEVYDLGDIIALNVKIYPETLEAAYIANVQLEVDDEGCYFDGLNLHTEGATKEVITVNASLEVGTITLYASASFRLYSPVETITITHDIEGNNVYPGKRYRLFANVEPASANQNIVWSIEEATKGITLENDILTIEEAVDNYKLDTFTVKATATDKSDIWVLNIIRPNYLQIPVQTLYSDDLHDINITFPDEVNLEGAKLYRFNKSCDFTVNGKTITVDPQKVKEIPDTDITFRLELADGSYYRFYATYISHSKYTVNNIDKNAIAIGSVKDFKKYFNIMDYDPTRFNNYYSKTFYLTADIDFGGATIYGIGYNDENAGISKRFTGKIYGMGHTISNAKITDNEKYHVLSDTDKTKPTRSSKYSVGFFGSYGGMTYDLVLDNISITANSWNGGFAGTMTDNTVAENVALINCEVKNANGVNYTGGGLRTGRFTAQNHGIVIACSFNGSMVGLIGESL